MHPRYRGLSRRQTRWCVQNLSPTRTTSPADCFLLANPAPCNNTGTGSSAEITTVTEQFSIAPLQLALSSSSLPSPPLSPSRTSLHQHTSSPPLPAPVAVMQNSRYVDAPPAAPRGMTQQDFSSAPRNSAAAAPPSASNAWESQDARSNLAVQPVTSASTVKLKKNAVKMFGPAGPTATRPATSVSPAVLPPTSGPVKPEAETAKVYVIPCERNPEITTDSLSVGPSPKRKRSNRAIILNQWTLCLHV